jgi:hypothetical protein
MDNEVDPIFSLSLQLVGTACDGSTFKDSDFFLGNRDAENKLAKVAFKPYPQAPRMQAPNKPETLRPLPILSYPAYPLLHSRSKSLRPKTLQGYLAHKKTPTPLGPP